MDELQPCPFCGESPNLNDIRIKNHWTGMRNEIISAEVMHWCPRADGELQNVVIRKAKTLEAATAAWNQRR